MTDEEHKLLVENNIMLKQLLAYISNKDNLKDFTMNVLANIISNN